MRHGGVVAGWIALVRRRWRWGAGVGAVVFGLAAAIVLLSRPVYRAESRLRLGEAPPAPGVSPTSGIMGLFRMGGDPFSNDLELLASRTLAEQVAEAVAQNVKLVAPRGWTRDSLFTSVRATRETVKATYRLSWGGDGSVTVIRSAPSDSAVGTFAAGEPIRFDGVELVPGPRRPGAPDAVQVKTLKFDEAAFNTQKKLKVARTRREANVIAVQWDDQDPQVALGGVRNAVEAFIAQRSRLFARESGQTSDSLRLVSERTKAELTQTEAALAAYQTSSGLVAPEAQSEAAVKRLVEAQVELETARQDLDAIETAIARADTVSNEASAWTALVSHPRFLTNETIGTLLSRLTLLEEQRTALAAKRAETNVDYRTIVEQQRFIEGSLRSVAVSYRTALKERIAALEEVLGRMRTELASVPDKALEIARLERQARLLGQVFLFTEQRLREEDLREALTYSNVQVIDEAELGYRPIWPRKKLGLAVGMALAMGFAVLAMFVVESADASVRSAAQLSTLAGAPVLAALPLNGRLSPPAASEAVVLAALGRGAAAQPPPLVVAAVDGNGGAVVADAVRAVLASGSPGVARREIHVAEPVISYAAACSALALGGPVLLAVEQGRTAIADVGRAVRLLREAGGGAAGTVVVCRSEEEAGDLWA